MNSEKESVKFIRSRALTPYDVYRIWPQPPAFGPTATHWS
jgi:hypothetical protein